MKFHISLVYVIVLTFTLSNVSGFQNSFRKGIYKSRQQPGLPAAQWFTQQLDHFNYEETRTWQQRYFVNETFYAPGGPAFLRIVGEGAADPIWSVEGQWIEYAQQFNAITFQVEHRFYGESHPTPDASIENLKYLNSDQALADVANFRTAIAEQYGLQNAKWIIFGGSYAGSLTAWFRLKYPHLADGAVASSAPLLAEINFEEYLGIVQTSLAEVSATCNPAITSAVDQIDALLAQGQSGWDTIASKFRLCTPLDGTNGADVATLYMLLCSNFQGVVQYNKDNREFQGSLATNITIETVCGIMDDPTIGPEIDRYAAVNSILMDAYSESCLPFTYNEMTSYLRTISWDSPGVAGAARQWTYQTCTEYGWYQSTDLPASDQPFGQKFPVSYFVDQCADIYGPKFNETLLENGVNQTNIIYGGIGPQITKIIFPNGSVDPWHNYGILTDLNSEALSLYIQGTAHCADSYPSSPDDSIELVQARDIIRQNIATWIS